MRNNKALYTIIGIGAVSIISAAAFAWGAHNEKNDDSDYYSSQLSGNLDDADWDAQQYEKNLTDGDKIGMIANYMLGRISYDEGLDINGDMKINVFDLIEIKRKYVEERLTASQTEAEFTDAVTVQTDIPATQPPVTEPPVTEPPVTEPPVTEPPATEPPATEPPATEPPATEPPATEPPAASDKIAQYQAEVLRLVNVERANAGLSPLSAHSSLNSAATIRASEIMQVFDHVRPDGSSWDTVLNQFNITKYAWGENIAAGYPTPEDVVEGWMNSEGHRENILNSNYTHLGVGYAEASSGYGYYWVQIFIGQ